jgi:hypothetical protein
MCLGDFLWCVHLAVLVSGSLEVPVSGFFMIPFFEFHVHEDTGKPTGHETAFFPLLTRQFWIGIVDIYIVVANSNTFVSWFVTNTVQTN